MLMTNMLCPVFLLGLSALLICFAGVPPTVLLGRCFLVKPSIAVAVHKPHRWSKLSVHCRAIHLPATILYLCQETCLSAPGDHAKSAGNLQSMTLCGLMQEVNCVFPVMREDRHCRNQTHNTCAKPGVMPKTWLGRGAWNMLVQEIFHSVLLPPCPR